MFWLWIVNSLVHSVMLFWLSYGAITQDVAWSNGRDAGYLMFGNMVYTVSGAAGETDTDGPERLSMISR